MDKVRVWLLHGCTNSLATTALFVCLDNYNEQMKAQYDRSTQKKLIYARTLLTSKYPALIYSSTGVQQQSFKTILICCHTSFEKLQ